MSAFVRDVLAAYLTAAVLVAVGFGLLRAALALGMERRLDARQTLRVGAMAFLAWALRRYARLRRKLETLPVLRRVGRVRVVLGDAADGALSVWFPGGGAWAVVPAEVLEDPEALRLTVRHELQHHRQRDTVFAYARLGFDSAFFWSPFGRRDVSGLVRTGKLNGYTATVQAGVLLLRNPHLLD